MTPDVVVGAVNLDPGVHQRLAVRALGLHPTEVAPAGSGVAELGDELQKVLVGLIEGAGMGPVKNGPQHRHNPVGIEPFQHDWRRADYQR